MLVATWLRLVRRSPKVVRRMAPTAPGLVPRRTRRHETGVVSERMVLILTSSRRDDQVDRNVVTVTRGHRCRRPTSPGSPSSIRFSGRSTIDLVDEVRRGRRACKRCRRS
jgi:hypothetical protein